MTDVQLRRTISQWCDGSLDEHSFDRLSDELRESAQARSIFVGFIQLHVSLRELTVADGDSAAIVERAQQRLIATSSRSDIELSKKTRRADPTIDSRYRRFRRLLYIGSALAAMVLVVIALLPNQIDGIDSGPIAAELSPIAPDTDGAKKPSQRSPIARVVSISHDCRWKFDRKGRPRESDDDQLVVRPGAIVRVMAGELTLSYINGVQVHLMGQALFGVESSMRGRVLLGKCRTTVSPGAEGFTLEAPNATVVDLGTEFGLEVDQGGGADVVVYEGSIEVDSDSIDDRSELRTSLKQGEALRIEDGGSLSRLASVVSHKFARPSSQGHEQVRRPLILKVDDNLQRVWKYYEIVHGGMREDVKAFVDNENQHEWNGLTRLGMPECLVGGDYVKMFKGDQIRGDIEIHVTLGERSDLYILFDERVPTPAWLKSEFVRTGDRIGLDMGPFEGKTGNQYENGVGAGNSVDRVAVVWRCREPADGTIILGATESGVVGTEMYGIVAQPAAD